jgi:hypothetical protein
MLLVSAWIARSACASTSDDAIALPIVMVRMSVSTKFGTRGARFATPAGLGRLTQPQSLMEVSLDRRERDIDDRGVEKREERAEGRDQQDGRRRGLPALGEEGGLSGEALTSSAGANRVAGGVAAPRPPVFAISTPSSVRLRRGR